MSIVRSTTVALALLGGLMAWSADAEAAVTITASPQGSDVIFRASGSINLVGGSSAVIPPPAQIDPSAPNFILGTEPPVTATRYHMVNSVPTFGSGGTTFATSATGKYLGMTSAGSLLVDSGYVSGTSLASTTTFENATIAGLGLTRGTYVFGLAYGGARSTTSPSS